MTPPFAVQAQGLQVSAGAHVLLRGLDLQIAPGEQVALVGHNGAGKSSLLRALSGFGQVSQGRLQVLGTDLSQARSAPALRALRCQVAQVHQGLHLVSRLSALDNVLIGGAGRFTSPRSWWRRWPAAERDAALAALARVGLAHLGAQRCDQLSGGERQKVAIARALHQHAPLLLADEPTASLDAQAADDVTALLASVARERGATLVCVLHDLDLVPKLAQRAIALRRGSVVADLVVDAGTPARLRALLT
jgi:phosphonate transport system ATP-binding protein